MSAELESKVKEKSLEGACLCGELTWTFRGPLDSTTACNCTACRRYGALWAYGNVGQEITVAGANRAYFRGGRNLGYHFCESCGNLGYWLGTATDGQGHTRIAVNLRLARDPDQIQDLLIDHFDGFGTFEDLPRDGKCVKDLWF